MRLAIVPTPVSNDKDVGLPAFGGLLGEAAGE
jgi:hypothetical protein